MDNFTKEYLNTINESSVQDNYMDYYKKFYIEQLKQIYKKDAEFTQILLDKLQSKVKIPQDTKILIKVLSDIDKVNKGNFDQIESFIKKTNLNLKFFNKPNYNKTTNTLFENLIIKNVKYLIERFTYNDFQRDLYHQYDSFKEAIEYDYDSLIDDVILKVSDIKQQQYQETHKDTNQTGYFDKVGKDIEVGDQILYFDKGFFSKVINADHSGIDIINPDGHKIHINKRAIKNKTLKIY